MQNTIGLRDSTTKTSMSAPCDTMEVVFGSTDTVVMSPQLWRQSPPDVPDTWHLMQNPTYEYTEYTGIPGLKRWYWGWTTYSEKNWEVEFKVIYTKPKPPPQPPEQVVVGPDSWVVGNTVVTSDDVILPWNGEDELAIEWNVAHADWEDLSFTTTVRIYEIDGVNPIRTVVLYEQERGPGSIEWNGERDQGGTADPGIYVYKVTSVHEGFGMCEEQDKSQVLTISNVTVSDFEWVSGTHPPQAKVWLEWDLSIDAEVCRFEVYAPCLNEVPIIDPADKQLAPTGGHHFRWVQFQVCSAHMGDYTLVLWADETTETGEQNRSTKPKHALQSGTVMEIWPPAYAATGQLEWWEVFNQIANTNAVEGAADELRRVDGQGTRYAPGSGFGSDQPTAVVDWMRRSSVIHTLTHGLEDAIGGIIFAPIDQEGPPSSQIVGDIFPSDPSRHYYNLAEEQAAGLRLDQCLLVFYAGCETAKEDIAGNRPLLDQTLAMGADAVAGFEESVTWLHLRTYLDAFWQEANTDGVSVQEADAEALQWVLIQLGDGCGVETFWTSDWRLRLRPARFGN